MLYEIQGYDEIVGALDDETLFELADDGGGYEAQGYWDGDAAELLEESETGFYFPGLIPQLDQALGLGGPAPKAAAPRPAARPAVRPALRRPPVLVRRRAPAIRRPAPRIMRPAGAQVAQLGAQGVVQRPYTENLLRTLPVNSSGNVTAGSTQVVSVRPQVLFRCERFVISDSQADDWLIGDIKQGTESMFAASGTLPGGVFSASAEGIGVQFTTVSPGIDIQITVQNVSGVDKPFRAMMIGRAIS